MWRISTLSSNYYYNSAGATQNNQKWILTNEQQDGNKKKKDIKITLRNSSQIKIFSEDEDESGGLPAKRARLSKSASPSPRMSLLEAWAELRANPVPPMPRLHSPIPFFISTLDPTGPNGLCQDEEFVDWIGSQDRSASKSGPVGLGRVVGGGGNDSPSRKDLGENTDSLVGS